MEPPFSETYQDVYFSAHGGLEEKRHVFMDGNDLPARFAGRSDFVICELGFGTGLSVLATAAAFLENTQPDQHLHIWSIEAHPMTAEALAVALAPFAPKLAGLDKDLVRAWPRPISGIYPITLRGRVHVMLVIGEVTEVLPPLNLSVDAWYLDGFTPAKNPAMWSPAVFDAMANLSAQGATAATYSAARVVKEGLTRAGFAPEKRKGFGYKSDMITARFSGTGRAPLSARRNLRVLIHGGGLAGTAAAYALRAAGHQPVIIAPHGLADAASGNPRGLYNPRFSARLSPSALFYRAAFTRFLSFLRAQDPARTGHIMNGALHLMRDDASEKKLRGFLETWGFGAEDARLLTADQASEVAGLCVPYGGVFLPFAGSVCPPAICALYAEGVEVRPEPPPDASTFDAEVIASGKAALGHPACANLNLQAVRGQISVMRAGDISARIKTNLCYGGYVTPPDANGMHVLGSTFQHWLNDPAVRPEDHTYVMDLLRAVAGDVFTPADIVAGRASFRVAAPNRLPVIGRLPLAGDDGPPLYISAAHGSHGLISTHVAGVHIAEAISDLPSTLPCLPE